MAIFVFQFKVKPISGYHLTVIITKSIMPKSKLPDWKNEPLKFAFSPDEALRRGALARPRRGWGKAITTGRKARR